MDIFVFLKRLSLAFLALSATSAWSENCGVFLLPGLEFDPQTKMMIQEATQKAIDRGRLRVLGSRDQAPSIQVQPWGKDLSLPAEYSLEAHPGLALQALVGLPEHPFNSAAEPGKIQNYKAHHKLALEAFVEQSQAQRKGLLVAPPGFGKSVLAHDFLASRLALGGLHISLADYRLNITELKKTLSDLPIRKLDTQDVIFALREGKRPSGLWVTTSAAFRRLYFALHPKKQAALRQALTTLIYDEAHHIGAPRMKQIVEDLGTDPAFEGYVFGLTATPFHQGTDLQAIFDNQTYWAYLDPSPKWGVRRNAFEVIDQTYQAIARGELTPFNRMFFLTSQTFQTQLPLFMQAKAAPPSETDDASFVLNPDLYPAVFAYLKPLIDLRKKTLLIANTIDEANRLSDYLKINYNLPVFMVHSEAEIATADSIGYFKRVQRGIMVAVRMMDEAVNVPDLDLIIDLNSSSSVRQFAQRLGRGLRLEVGKFDVDFVCFNEINAETSKELIELIDHLRRNSSQGASGRSASEPRQNSSQTPQTGVLDITNEQAWTALESTIRNFWRQSGRWRPYSEARTWAQENNIQSRKHYIAAEKPPGIPASPQAVYKNEWTTWADFLGTGNISSRNKVFRSYTEAQKWAMENGIETSEDYRMAQRPADIPANPHTVYREEWKGWRDFLGRGYRPYSEAQQWAREKGLKSYNDYRNAEKPKDIPYKPDMAYRDEWVNWGTFLGTGATKERVYRSYSETQKWARENNIKSFDEYRAVPRPPDIPSAPQSVYKGDWMNWGDFLGTGNVSSWKRAFASYSEAKAWVRENNITTRTEFRDFQKPKYIPSNPRRVYADEWTNWNDFLGSKRPPNGSGK